MTARSHLFVVAFTAVAVAALLVVIAPSAASAAETTAYAEGPVAIPDGHGSARLVMHVSLPAGQTVTQVRPNFRVRHPRTHQLKLYLKSPEGTRVLLDDQETHGANFGEHACDPNPDLLSYMGFDDNSGTPLSSGSAPYSGYFIPHDPLSAVVGEDPSGGWRVIAKDTRHHRHGSLLCGFLDLYYGP
jgi:subtilisin-like proprotein convertase family protein